MLTGIVKNIHLLLFLYFSYEMYEFYKKSNADLEETKNNIPRIQNEIQKIEKKLSELEKYFASIEEAKKNIELVAQKIESIQKQLPSDISPTQNLALIKDLADKMNLKDISLKPAANINKGFYSINGYDLKAKGTYLQFLILFEKISESKRLLNVSQMKMNRIEERQRGRFQLVDTEVKIEAFQYNKNYKESRGLKEIEQKIKDKEKEKAEEKKNSKKNNKKKGKK